MFYSCYNGSPTKDLVGQLQVVLNYRQQIVGELQTDMTGDY